MKCSNSTAEIYFTLTVFSDLPWMKIFLFLLFLTIYLVTLTGNLLLILLRRLHPHLHTPMYFFLSHLSFIDICFTTTIAPKFLANLLTDDASISFLGCAVQMCFSLAFGSIECLLLAIMAYDRHVAICQPLRYHELMGQKICFLLVSGCWIAGFVISFLHTLFTFSWSYCNSKEIGHFFCEIQPLLRLACADTHAHELSLFVTTITIVLCSFLLTFFSYVHIISTILKIQSSEGKSKVFSTCSSHLLVVLIFYGTVMSIYMRPISSYTPERDRIFAVLYCLMIPMCNPLIYSLRNKDVQAAMQKTIAIKCYILNIPRSHTVCL